MSNSPLIKYSRQPTMNKSNPRTEKISKITIHHWSGVINTAQDGLNYFCSKSCMENRQVSSNYIIGNDGSIGMMIPENRRAWTSSSSWNDQRAITIEVSNSRASGDYPISDAAMKSLIALCIDICKRNGKNKLIWFGDKDKTLNYSPKSGEMILTVHRWFANKSCPGNWMYARMGDLAEKVTKALQGSADNGSGDSEKKSEQESVKYYRVRKSWTDSKTQKGAYKILDNAKKCADQNPGYKVFDADGKVVYEPKAVVPAVKVPFLVKVSISDLNIRKGPGVNHSRIQFCPPGIYTIVAVSEGAGASMWGKLKSGIGWLSLDFCLRL